MLVIAPFHLNTCTADLAHQLGLKESQLLACHRYKPDANGNYQPLTKQQAEFDRHGRGELQFSIAERQFLEWNHFVRKPGMGADGLGKMNPSVREMFVRMCRRKFWLSFYILAPERIVRLLFDQLTPRHAHFYPEMAKDKRGIATRNGSDIIRISWSMMMESRWLSK